MSEQTDKLREDAVALQDKYEEENPKEEEEVNEEVNPQFDYTEGEEDGDDGAGKDNEDKEKDEELGEGKEENKDEDKNEEDEDEIKPMELFPEEEGGEEGVEGKGKEEDDDNDGDDEEEGINPEDAKLIDRRVAKQMEPFKKQVVDAEKKERNSILNAFLSEEGKIFKDQSEQIRSLVHDKRFQELGIKKEIQVDVAVAMTLGWKGLLKIGAERERGLSSKAKATRSGGSGSNTRTGRSAGGLPDVNRMTSDNFNKLRDGVKAGKVKFSG